MNLPDDFKKKMRLLLKEEAEEFFLTYERERAFGIRRNPLKAEEKTFLEKMPFTLSRVPWAEEGYYYRPEEQPGKHVFHEAGVYYIQEPSAMSVAEALDIEPGDVVCDLCAAPGGKTTQIAGKMKGKGLLVTNEIHPARAKILSQNVERMGIRNAVVLNEDPEKLKDFFVGFFDKILVDAPCSGEGMFRKEEQAGEQWSLKNVELCCERQLRILEAASGMLRCEGTLIYSTCTFSPEENEGVISRFVNSHPEFSIVEIVEKNPEKTDYGLFFDGHPEWIENAAPGIEKTKRLWPHHLKGEGHFIARLKKEDGLDRKQRSFIKGEKDAKKLVEYDAFAKEYLKIRPEGIPVFHGDYLYAVPEQMIPLKGLRALRPGLELGQNKKNRFEPSHALGMSFLPGEAAAKADLTFEEAFRYQKGEGIRKEAEKGWVFLEVMGFPMGIGKSVNGMIKNHYPKGIRV